MRIVRHLVVLSGLGVMALAGYHVVASAGTFVASLDANPPRVEDFTTRFSALGKSTYSLTELSALEPTVDQIASRYVDPSRVDYAKMFAAGLEAVEHFCPEVLLRLDGQRLHVSVDRFSTMLNIRSLNSPEDLVAESARVAQILETHLPSEYKLPEVEYAFINGMLSTLDPHTIVLPPEQARKMQEDNDGSFGGLGISIRMVKGELTVDYPMMDTPAYKAGLRPADKIVKIEGEGTFNMDIEDAVSKMRGPAGTAVTITIDAERFALPKDVKLVRAEIKPEQVWGELLEGNIGYVQIPGFNQLVDSQLDEQLSALARKAGPGGLKGLVLDLRDNPGGYLDQAKKVSDKFLGEGVIVSTVGPMGTDREEMKANGSGTEPSYPIAVLMSGNSASAAEIVAGALKNQERAIIIGERSFGKGSVQELMDLSGGARLKLTVRRYLTPGDHNIQEIGIPPDIELVRSYVSPPRDLKEYGVQSGPRVSLYSRDGLMREADLSGHLGNDRNLETPPVYRLRYLAADPADTEVRSDRKDIRTDFEVTLARDVLLSVRGGRRADALRGAESVVISRGKAQDLAIEQAFSSLGIDWKDCENPAAADVDLQISFAPVGGKASSGLTAGDLSTVQVVATNRGDRPLCRTLVRAKSEGGNDVLDGLEFYLGRIDPGKSRSYEARAKVPGGYPSELAIVRLDMLDSAKQILASRTLDVQTVGTPMPRYAWDWKFDDSQGGDGDGVPEIGETPRLLYTIKNVGDGVGGEVTFNLRKLPGMGKTVELKEARIEKKGLEPGETLTGQFSFHVLSAPPEPKLGFELSVRDNERYDYAALNRSGFFAYYVATETLEFEIGKSASGKHREPPRIEVTRAPPAVASETSLIISGVASDDVGVRDVIIYQGGRKLAYAGGGTDNAPLPTVPFSATAELVEGTNLIVVAVRDVDGFTSTQSFDVLRRPAVATAPTTGPGGSVAPTPPPVGG